jgi:predicted permease
MTDPLSEHRAQQWLSDAHSDVRFAARTLRKQPGFTAVAILTLALGIGANTATFSVVDAVLLRPLPYRDSGGLVRIWETVPGAEIGSGKGPDRRYGAMDVSDVLAVAAHARTITQIASFGLVRPTTTIDGETVALQGYSVTVDLLPMLGVAPLFGRTFTSEDRSRGGDRVLMLGYDAWRRFGATHDILGRTVTLSGDPANPFGGSIGLDQAYTVIGVMPRGFRFPHDNAQFWIPRVLIPPASGRPLHLETIARLSDGATPAAAAAELEAIQRARRATTVAGAAERSRPRFEVIRLQDEITRPIRPALIVLTIAVCAVLLIACVNMATLLLARAESRHREISVRAAIGASRGRLIRQMLTESLLLSFAGGAAGVALAVAGIHLFQALGTTLGRADLGLTAVFPRLDEIGVDWTVLAYATFLAVATGLVFGLVPALQHSRGRDHEFLRDATSSPQTRLKSGLVIVEVALATVLLVGGGLLINSFVRLATVDVGFDPSALLTFQITTSPGRTPEQQRAFAEAVVERLRQAPGIQGAAYARQLPLVQLQDAITLTARRNGVETMLGEAPDVRFVSRDYLQTIGARLLAGRQFDARDCATCPGTVIINEAFVRREFGGQNPLGQFVYFGPQRQMPLEIVGIVSDIRQFSLDLAPEPQYFMDMRQIRTDPAFRLPPLFPVGAYYAVRSGGDRGALLAGIRAVVRQLDAHATLDNVATMDQIVANSVTRPWMYTVLLGIFAAVALSLASIGLYGVMACTVAQRTREIGIRMALGADRRRVLGLVLGQGATLTAIGLILGLAGAVVATRSLAGLLFGLTPLDPITYGAAAAMFAAVAALASYVPARQATAVDPIVALSVE